MKSKRNCYNCNGYDRFNGCKIFKGMDCKSSLCIKTEFKDYWKPLKNKKAK